MSATSYDSLMGQVMPFLPGAPYPMVISAFNQSARELCRRAKCWSEWQDITLVADQAGYSLTPATDDSSIRVIRAIIIPPRKPMTPITNDEIIRNRPYLLSAIGEPTAYVVNQDMSVTLYPKPTTAQAGVIAKARVSFVPNSDSVTLPADLIERFEEVLIDGCKARMFATPGAWFEPNASAFHKQEFANGVAKAEIDLLTDYGSADLIVQKRAFI